VTLNLDKMKALLPVILPSFRICDSCYFYVYSIPVIDAGNGNGQ